MVFDPDGYIPDLVPEKPVGIASALVGLFQVLGNAAGFAIGAVAVSTNSVIGALLLRPVVEPRRAGGGSVAIQ